MNTIEENLIKHNIKIPDATKPIANYSPYLIIKDFFYSLLGITNLNIIDNDNLIDSLIILLALQIWTI